MSGASLSEIADYLGGYLRIGEIPDEPAAVNGLQVENSGRVQRIVAAVDASQATIDGAANSGGRGALLLVHHGLFWDGNQPLTGRRYRRIRALLEADAALYSAHIPLDVHPEVGNNVVLAERLGLSVEGWFGDYRGVPLGVWGRAPHGLETRGALKSELARVLGSHHPMPMHVIAGGPDHLGRIGIVTGAGGSMIRAARDAGLDTLVTGEGPHHTYFDAAEWGLNVIYAGHYATETLGVQALASHLGDRFDLPWDFHDHPTGL